MSKKNLILSKNKEEQFSVLIIQETCLHRFTQKESYSSIHEKNAIKLSILSKPKLASIFDKINFSTIID